MDAHEELSAGLMRPTFVSAIFDKVDPGMRDAFRENLRREVDRLAPTAALNAAELTLRDARAAIGHHGPLGPSKERA